MIARYLALALLGGGFAALTAPACSDPKIPASCGEIPDGGCPDDFDADDCADPTCAAVYTCASGGWVELETCPLHPVEAVAVGELVHGVGRVDDDRIDLR